MKTLTVRRNGHTYGFLYRSQHERAALRALASCPEIEKTDVLALVCYLGHDPRELGLAEAA